MTRYSYARRVNDDRSYTVCVACMQMYMIWMHMIANEMCVCVACVSWRLCDDAMWRARLLCKISQHIILTWTLSVISSKCSNPSQIKTMRRKNSCILLHASCKVPIKYLASRDLCALQRASTVWPWPHFSQSSETCSMTRISPGGLYDDASEEQITFGGKAFRLIDLNRAMAWPHWCMQDNVSISLGCWIKLRRGQRRWWRCSIKCQIVEKMHNIVWTTS